MFTDCNFESLDSECEKSPRSDVANAPRGTRRQNSVRTPTAPKGGTPGDLHHGLLAAAQAGDRAALDELLAGQRSHAMASALRVLHDPDDAEDAVQDAFVKVWRQLSRFEGRSSFATWVHRIVVNASLDLMRKLAVRPQPVGWTHRQHDLDDGTGADEANEATPESQLAGHQIGNLVRLAIAGLPFPQRQAVELHELEGCSCQEIAAVARCPVGTVMSRLFDGRARLTETLGTELLDELAA
jgi:RNA polymerase sigma-70 factor, ECF subfamily